MDGLERNRRVHESAHNCIEESGTSLKAAVGALRNHGVVPESLLPFHIETNMSIGDENTFYATAAARRVASYFNLRKDLNRWGNWLVAHGPIMAELSVDETWDNATATQGKLDAFHSDTVRGGMRYASSAT
ncbi:MAG TPA: hypothetical protein VGP06_15965 [Janthinobacterium sp.]|nr:hypothetical protein [Janthinobacterium sp.]